MSHTLTINKKYDDLGLGSRESFGQAARRHVGLLMGHIVPWSIDALPTDCLVRCRALFHKRALFITIGIVQ